MKFPSPSGLISSRSAKPRASARAKAPPPAKRRPAVNGLSQDELLAKIDSLDWEPSILPGSTVGVMPKSGSPATVLKSPRHGHSAWPIVGGIVLLAAAALIYFLGRPAAPVPVQPVVTEQIQPAPAPDADRAAALAVAAAAEEKRAMMYAKAVEESERKTRRLSEQVRLAKAEKARVEQESLRQEEARLQAEKDAAARAAKVAEAPVAKAPSSPQELCTDEKNIFSRGFCEGRVCGKPEWRNHPYCVKRMEEQLNRVSGGGG